jgi:hypothetical protein
MGLAFLVLLGTAVAVHALLRRTLGCAPPLGCNALANLLLFTPVQWRTCSGRRAVLPAADGRAGLRVAGVGLGPPGALRRYPRWRWSREHLLTWPGAVAGGVAMVLARDFPPRARRLPRRLDRRAGGAGAVLHGRRLQHRCRRRLRAGDRRARMRRWPRLSRRAWCASSSACLQPDRRLAAPPRRAAPAGVGPTLAFLLSPRLAVAGAMRAWDRGLPWVGAGGVALPGSLAVVGRTAMKGWEHAILPHYVSIASMRRAGDGGAPALA